MENNEFEKDNPGLKIAPISDRVAAFGIDAVLFSTGYFLTLKVVFPADSVFLNPHSGLWAVMWMGFFLIYQGYMSCEGRVSLGKGLLGIRIVELKR